MAAQTVSRLRRNNLTFLFAALFVFIVSACNTLPKPSSTVMGPAGAAQGQWRAKALVKNLKTGKANTIDLEMVANEPDRLRIEALGPFSVHLASVASRGDVVRISMTREKKFLIVPADRHSLSRLIPVRAAPADLIALLFDRRLDQGESGWSCLPGLAPEWKCSSGMASIARQTDDEGRRRFQFLTPDAQMDLVITEAPSETPLGDSAYDLKPPAGFKIEERK